MQMLHHMYNTGEPFMSQAVLVQLARTAAGPIEDSCFDLSYLARYNE